jgi:hypothetical protein
MARPKAHTRWTVLPHAPIERLSERLWRIEGALPDMPLRRVMAIARRSDGGLIVHNAIAVDDAALAEIEAWGPVAAITPASRWTRRGIRPDDRDPPRRSGDFPGHECASSPSHRAPVRACLPVRERWRAGAAVLTRRLALVACRRGAGPLASRRCSAPRASEG